MAPEADLAPERNEREEAPEKDAPGGVIERCPFGRQPDRPGQAECES